MKKILLSMVLGLSFVCGYGGPMSENSDASVYSFNGCESMDNSVFCDFDLSKYVAYFLELLGDKLNCSNISCCEEDEDEIGSGDESEKATLYSPAQIVPKSVPWQRTLTHTPARTTTYNQQHVPFIYPQFAPQPGLPRPITQQSDGGRVTIDTWPEGIDRRTDYMVTLTPEQLETTIFQWPLSFRTEFLNMIQTINNHNTLTQQQASELSKVITNFLSSSTSNIKMDCLIELGEELKKKIQSFK